MKFLAPVFFLFSTVVFAQSSLSSSTHGGLNDVACTDKEVIIPYVQLVSTTEESPVRNIHGGTLEDRIMVYNTVTVNDVRPGYYYWETDKWKRHRSKLRCAR